MRQLRDSGNLMTEKYWVTLPSVPHTSHYSLNSSGNLLPFLNSHTGEESVLPPLQCLALMSRSRGYCFTINNPVDDTSPQTWPYEYLIYQKEKGSTVHLQGYVYFKNARTLTQVKKFDAGAHWTQARGTALDNTKYCSKEETRLEGPWTLGVMPQQGKRSDLEGLKSALKESKDMSYIQEHFFSDYLRYGRNIEKVAILLSKPRNWEMTVEVLWGATGVGKTRLAFEENPKAYWKSKGLWWDGYLNEEVVVIDEYYGWLPWDYILRLTDRYPFSVESKGGCVQFVAKKIIFTSNDHPKEWYKRMTEKYGWDANTNPLCRRISKITEISKPQPVQSYEEYLKSL